MTEKCMTFSSDCLRMNSSIVFNGDESRRGSTHHVHGRISVFSNKNKKLHENTFTTIKHAQVDSSAEQNLSYNFETLHHDRAVKLPTRQQW